MRKKQEFKVTFVFEDGREIKEEDFVRERDLKPEQEKKIVEAFQRVFCK